MTGDAEARLPAAHLINQTRTVQVQSAELRAWSVAARARARALTAQTTAASSQSRALTAQTAAARLQSQALRSRPVRRPVAAPVFVSPAAIRAQVKVTYRELIAATRRRAVTRAREMGFLGG